jgi:hypothetical protein
MQERQPSRLRQLMYYHQKTFLRIAAEDDRFLQLVINHLEVEATFGPMTIDEVRRRFDAVEFISGYEDYKRAENLALNHGLCMINLGYVHWDDEIMWRFQRLYPECHVHKTSSAEVRERFSAPARESAETRRFLGLLREIFSGFDCEIALTSDDGNDAATMIVSRDRNLRAGAESHLKQWMNQPAGGTTTGAWPSLMEGSVSKSTFTLNLRHPVVSRLSRHTSLPVIRRWAMLLYYNALLVARGVPSPTETALYNQSLQEIFSLETDSGNPASG